MLKRYWFLFDGRNGPWRLKSGCGITAANSDDAWRLLSERISQQDFATVAQCIEDIDVSTLDPRHVLPNVEDVTERGIWFPLGLRN